MDLITPAHETDRALLIEVAATLVKLRKIFGVEAGGDLLGTAADIAGRVGDADRSLKRTYDLGVAKDTLCAERDEIRKLLNDLSNRIGIHGDETLEDSIDRTATLYCVDKCSTGPSPMTFYEWLKRRAA